MIKLPTPNDMLLARKATGLNQADAAKESGVSLSAISRIERGLDVSHSKWTKLFDFYSKYDKR